MDILLWIYPGERKAGCKRHYFLEKAPCAVPTIVLSSKSALRSKLIAGEAATEHRAHTAVPLVSANTPIWCKDVTCLFPLCFVHGDGAAVGWLLWGWVVGWRTEIVRRQERDGMSLHKPRGMREPCTELCPPPQIKQGRKSLWKPRISNPLPKTDKSLKLAQMLQGLILLEILFI